MVRRAVKELLSANSDDWVICGEAIDGEDAVRKAEALSPDVVLLDLSIPLLHGLTVAKTIRRDYPAVKVVLMSEQDTSVLSRMVEGSGTPYYIPKSRLAIDLIPLLRSFERDSGTNKP